MKKENTSLTYYLTRSLFLGYGISHLFLESGKDSYIGTILGIILGYLIICCYEKLILAKNNKKLVDILNKNKVIGLITRIIMTILSYIILLYILVIYTTFTASFLLFNTPIWFTIIPFILIGIYGAIKGVKVINRVGNILLPFSIILVFLSALSLTDYFKVDFFLPIMTNKPVSIFKTALIFAGISTLPNILTLHLDNNIRNYKKMYLIASLFILMTVIFVNGVFGEELINVFRFPEYMILKQLKLLNFIEKIENILSMAWAFDLFITAQMAIYSLRELLPKKHNKVYLALAIVSIIYLIIKVFSFNYTNEIKLFYTLPIISLVSVIVVISLLSYLIRRKN